MNGRMGMFSLKGFTIVELLIVVVVIAILAAVTIVAYNGIQNRAKLSAVQSAVSQGVKKVHAYAVLNSDMYPSSETEAGLASGDGTTYQVTSNNAVSPKQYCVTVTSNNLTYFQTNTMTSPIRGTCIGMLAWWPFNGDAKDASGNGIDGTVIGATVTSGVGGVASTAYQLGETAQYISIGSPSSFAVLPNALTYSVWLARTGTSTAQWPPIMGANDSHTNFGIRTNNYGGHAYFEWGTSPFLGATYTGTSATSLSTLNEWHLVTVTFDGSVVRLYRDTMLVSTSSATALRPTMGTFQFTVPSNGWQGKVDDARVYNRALSLDEIQTMYAAGAQ